MTYEEMMSCLRDISNMLGSGMFQVCDEEEMKESGNIDNYVEDMELGIDQAIDVLKKLKHFVEENV